MPPRARTISFGLRCASRLEECSDSLDHSSDVVTALAPRSWALNHVLGRPIEHLRTNLRCSILLKLSNSRDYSAQRGGEKLAGFEIYEPSGPRETSLIVKPQRLNPPKATS